MQPAALLGRDVELARLEALLSDGRSVAVVGEAGIGKTSLIRAAAQRAGVDVHEGGALATLAWTPFLALRRAVGDGFHGDLTAIAVEVERRIGRITCSSMTSTGRTTRRAKSWRCLPAVSG